MKSVVVASLLVLAAPMAGAALGCGDLRYGSDEYKARMQQLARQANLPGGTYSKYHERVVNNLCQGDADDTRKLVDLGYVNAKDVAAIQRAIQVVDARPIAAPPPAVIKASNPNDLPLMNRAINGAFMQWSRQWMWDRYIPDSTVIAENQIKNGVYLIRGTFRFSRGGGVATIPFASALQRQESNWIVASLCYNDTTSGMTDCANSRTSAAARQFMGAVVIGGLISAMANGGGSPQYRDNGRDAGLESARNQREADDNSRRAERNREEAQETRDWYQRMNEPSTLMDPPKTIIDSNGHSTE